MDVFVRPALFIPEFFRTTSSHEIAGRQAPWALLNYQAENSTDMAMPMIRRLMVCFVISFLLCWIFLQQKNLTLLNRILLSLAIGLIGFFFTPYTNFIWYKAPDILAYLADGIVPWVILGYIGHKIAVKAVKP